VLGPGIVEACQESFALVAVASDSVAVGAVGAAGTVGTVGIVIAAAGEGVASVGVVVEVAVSRLELAA